MVEGVAIRWFVRVRQVFREVVYYSLHRINSFPVLWGLGNTYTGFLLLGFRGVLEGVAT